LSDRPFDLVLLGATGFAGGHAARYLHDHAPDGLRWAIAGRSVTKLKALAATLGDVPICVVDTGDADSVDAMARDTRVLLSTVGPFLRYGTPVVEACLRHGTDYADITGETPWVRGLLDRYADEAVASGARLVPFCGFDSVPSDLGAFLVARTCQRELGQDCVSVKAAFRMKGGLNGGTLATMLYMGEHGLSKQVMDPFLLNPPAHRHQDDKAAHYDPRAARFDDDLDAWTAPFLMGAINTRVVRRSAALFADAGESYGESFAYQEYQRCRSKWRARQTTLMMGAAFGLSAGRVGRRLLRTFGPAPGEGPSKASVQGGFFAVDLVGRGEDGGRVVGKIRADGDAGNRNTVRMLCEAGLLLATRREDLPAGSGFLTPATCFGDVLVDALRASGMTFEAHAAA